MKTMKYVYVILGGVVVYTIIATIYNQGIEKKSLDRMKAMAANEPLPPALSKELPNPLVGAVKTVMAAGYLVIHGPVAID